MKENEKDFYQLEENIIRLKGEIDELEELESPENKENIANLRQQIEKEWEEIKSFLTPVHIVQIARHPSRPYTLDYLK
ncbi:MAG: acetyl-CoA carboxylase carboxyl transferase subunit alpha, partial [Acidobacteriota bacterium]